jgi:hypothetical protein
MKTIEWQYLIVSYLFLGLSAGAYFPLRRAACPVASNGRLHTARL